MISFTFIMKTMSPTTPIIHISIAFRRGGVVGEEEEEEEKKKGEEGERRGEMHGCFWRGE